MTKTTETQLALTRAGLVEGMRLILPFVPGVVIFASAFGAAAVQKGLTLGQALFMSGAVYAGAAQLVSLELWTRHWTLASLLAITAVAATVNARMVLMGAALQPWLKGTPTPLNAVNLFFFTDANWITATRYQMKGGTDLGVMLGGGLFLWVVWVAATLPGYLLGSLMRDPKVVGFDLVMPIVFTAMAIPLWKGRRDSIAWGVAGVVALTVSQLFSGYAFIVAGALAGALAGAFIDD
ncbi:AzlC family ABC transporter permease [Chelatococcus sp. SYSU_G07232]|uniref:AzlC family ABC transporter permease n=1 Tax=Chelatococcus albus TaxID=3047466 RepID=A0ABT7AF11_9HYPH|nr:AzlC family ABC transporter permease [Chelatococcus sp. SYSU_G07232]MDJ1157956.1 AzlC family ABC transporter permease [Chelatococcus sp. SYSU_G07232]